MTTETITRPEDAPSSIYGPDGRPQFFQDPAMDRFVAVLLQVTSELWVQTERLANLETVLAQKGHVTAEDLGALSGDSAIGDARDEEMRVFLNRVLAPLREPAN